MVHVAACVLTLPDGRFVLQRRDLSAPTHPGKLGFFGGHVEPNESWGEAAHRELAEETSLSANTLLFRPKGEWVFDGIKEGDEQIAFHVYHVAVLNIDFAVHEGSGAEAYSAEQILKRSDVANSTVTIIAELNGILR